MLRNAAKMMMISNGKMMIPIGPDITAPGSVMLYQRRSTRMANERKRPKVRRQDAAKRPLQEIRGHRNRRRQD